MSYAKCIFCKSASHQCAYTKGVVESVWIAVIVCDLQTIEKLYWDPLYGLC